MSVANVCRSDDTVMYHMNSAGEGGREEKRGKEREGKREGEKGKGGRERETGREREGERRKEGGREGEGGIETCSLLLYSNKQGFYL